MTTSGAKMYAMSHVVEAQVQIESKVQKRFIMFELQTLKPSTFNPGSTWGQPSVLSAEWPWRAE